MLRSSAKSGSKSGVWLCENLRTRPLRPDRAEAENEIFDPLQTRAGGVEARKGKIELRPIMGRKEKIAHFRSGVPFFEKIAQGIKIAEALRHFFMIDKEMLHMNPVEDETVAGAAFRLGDFIFVMGKHVVDAAAVDIDAFCQGAEWP